MTRTLKRILLALTLIILLPLLGLLLYVQTLEDEDVKAALSSLVKDTTNGQLELGGQLSWSLFPRLFLELNEGKLSLQGEQGTPLAQFDQAALGLKLWPLLQGQLIVKEIRFDGLQIQLSEESPQEYNWQRLLKKSAEADSQHTASAEPSEDSSGVTSGITTAIQKLALANSSLIYQPLDKSDGGWQVTDLQLTTNNANDTGQPFPLSMSLIAQRKESVQKYHLSFESELNWWQNQKIQFDKFQLELTPENTTTFTFKTAGTWELAEQSLQLPNWELSTANTRIQGSSLAGHFNDTTSLSTNLQGDITDLPQLLASLNLPFPTALNKTAFKNIRVDSKAALTNQTFLLSNTSLAIGDLSVTGELSGSQNFDRFVVNLEANHIDLDQLLSQTDEPPNSDNTKDNLQNSKAKTAANKSDSSFPTSQINAQIKSLRYQGMLLNDVTVAANTNAKRIKLTKLESGLYSGHLTASGLQEVSGASPKMRANLHLTNVQLKPLLNDWNSSDWLSGELNLQASLGATGHTTDTLISNLNGSLDYSLNNAVFQGLSLEQETCRAIAKVRNKTLSKTWEPTTKFEKMAGQFTIKQGIAKQTLLNAEIKQLAVAGLGEIDLLKNAFDYRLGIQVRGEQDETEPACEVNERYRMIYWPIRCQGLLTDTNRKKWCSVDQQGLSKLIQNQTKKRIEEKIQEKLFEELDSLFR